MKYIEEIGVKCKECENVEIIEGLKYVTFQGKALQVLDQSFYCDSRRIDDWKMTCEAIEMAKRKGFYEFNNNTYSVDNKGNLKINDEEFDDYKMVIEAIKRAEKLNRDISSDTCTKCKAKRSLEVLMPEELMKEKEKERKLAEEICPDIDDLMTCRKTRRNDGWEKTASVYPCQSKQKPRENKQSKNSTKS